RSRGLVLLENVAFPHHAQHATTQKLLADGAIGEVRDFSSAFTIPPLAAHDIRYQPDVGGGALLDIGMYPLRAALHYLGDQLEITAAVLRCHGGAGAGQSRGGPGRPPPRAAGRPPPPTSPPPPARSRIAASAAPPL